MGFFFFFLILFFSPSTLWHWSGVVRAFYSEPLLAAGLPLAVHCQVQGMVSLRRMEQIWANVSAPKSPMEPQASFFDHSSHFSLLLHLG